MPLRRSPSCPCSPLFEVLLTAALVFGATGPAGADDTSSRGGSCLPSATTLCLESGRFQVEIDWTESMDSGEGEVLLQFSDSTGFLSLRDPAVAEVLVRMIDGCGANGSYWVFLANVSDLGQTITVTDTKLGGQVQYQVSEGALGPPILDVGAFSCGVETLDRSASAEPGSLGGASLFLDQRFRVEVAYEDFGGMTGNGFPVPVTDRSGAFSLFSPENLELLVKMVPDSGTGFYEFVFSATTTVELDITVTDTWCGDVQIYNQPLGGATALSDPMAFELACTGTLFNDGFELGDTSAWSAVAP